MHDWGPADFSVVPAWGTDATAEVPTPGASRHSRLSDIFKQEILPCLVSHRQAAPSGRANPALLARRLAHGRFAEARAAVTQRLRSGAPALSVLLEDFAPAARRLGDLWRDDECDFVDVTIAMRVLGEMLRDLKSEKPVPERAASILISPAPGETHTFAADLVARVFQMAGWRAVRCEARDVGSWLARDRFHVAAFSLSCERRLPELREAISEARAASYHRRLVVLVGGPIFASRPGLAEGLGAELCASAADLTPQHPQAVLQSLRL